VWGIGGVRGYVVVECPPLSFIAVAIDDHPGMRAVAKWLHAEILPYMFRSSAYDPSNLDGHDKRTGAEVRISAEVFTKLNKFRCG
jgi:hypothetical protein